MFVLPPPHLPSSGARDELLQFGDPYNLQNGVKLREKHSHKHKTIHSLYDMELNVKYFTEQGNVVKRVSNTQIDVKKKGNTSKTSPNGAVTGGIQISSSTPINIPSSSSYKSTPISIPTSNKTSAIHIPLSKNSHKSGYMRSFGESSSDTASQSSTAGSYASSFEEGIEFINKSPPSVFYEIKDESTITVQIQPCAPGERLENILKDVVYVVDPKSVEGSLYFTNYQLMFISNAISVLPFSHDNNGLHPTGQVQKADTEISVPLAAISRFEKVDRQNGHFMFGGGEVCYSLDIFTKDFRRPMRFALNPTDHCLRDICQHLSKYIFPIEVKNVFAVSSGVKSTVELSILFPDLKTEYRRLGVGDPNSGWKFTDINADYSLCKSYPRVLAVPEAVTNEELVEVANFRSKSRIPVLSWRDKSNGVSITRTSQPKTGMSRTFRCKADEKVVGLIQATNSKASKLHILDARPMANALANMALGGGYENMTYYPNCEFKWMGISNIHVVRDSWDKLRTYCEANTRQSAEDAAANASSTWLSQVEASRWMDYVSTILSCTSGIVQLIHEKRESVFIHCSDGWDRTPQLSALAQLMLDKYYRTIPGFLVLIQKEWLHFGHKFGDRLGLNFVDTVFKDAERSPVFLQFLDAVYQTMQQFPTSFEFTDSMLLTIMEHAYSGKFGTFLFNYDSERDEAKIHELAPSLWAHILSGQISYQNPFYKPNGEPTVLYPSSAIQHLKFWGSYFLQHLSPPPHEKDQELQLGKQMKATIRSMEDKVSILEREREELLNKIKELQGRERALSNVTMTEDRKTPEFNGNPSSKTGDKYPPDIMDEWVGVPSGEQSV